ncbi:hypothetical protein QTP88_019510 [Uroleucon formosanum]
MAENKLSLTILLWNANGITNNTEELKLVLAEENIDIVFISKSRLFSSSKFKIFGYDCLQANHPDDLAHAGAALLISTKIPHSPFHPKSNQHMQIVATSININSIPTSIASAYFPPGSPFPVEDLSLFIQTLNHTYIIGADFNAKHETRSYRSKNTRGRTLHNFITIKRSENINCIGIANNELQNKMLREELTLEEAIQLYQAVEEAEINSKLLED